MFAGGLLPAAAAAQGRFDASPSLALTQVYDSNLFSSPSPQVKDLISRFTPSIEAGYRSSPLRLRARYAFDAEVYAEHPELSSKRVRQEASIMVRHQPVRSLTLSTSGSYSQTQTPSELNVTTGLEVDRRDARRIYASQSLQHRFGAFTTGDLEYAFTRDQVSGGTATWTHAARLELERRVSTRDSRSVGLAFRRFAFGEAGDLASPVLTLGWDRQLTRRLRLEFEGGPRLSGGRVGPELSVSLSHRLRRGEVSLSYAQTETTAIGVEGAVIAESIGLSLHRQLSRPLRISAAPSVWRSRRGGFEAMVYRVSLDATCQVAKPLALIGSYQFSLQRGSLDGREGGHFAHNIFLLRLAASAGN